MAEQEKEILGSLASSLDASQIKDGCVKNMEVQLIDPKDILYTPKALLSPGKVTLEKL